jgi:hypothetical protein
MTSRIFKKEDGGFYIITRDGIEKLAFTPLEGQNLRAGLFSGDIEINLNGWSRYEVIADLEAGGYIQQEAVEPELKTEAQSPVFRCIYREAWTIVWEHTPTGTAKLFSLIGDDSISYQDKEGAWNKTAATRLVSKPPVSEEYAARDYAANPSSWKNWKWSQDHGPYSQKYVSFT